MRDAPTNTAATATPYWLVLARRAVREGHGVELAELPAEDKLRVELAALDASADGDQAVMDAAHDAAAGPAREVLRQRQERRACYECQQ